jgi:serine/threonine protein kinase
MSESVPAFPLGEDPRFREVEYAGRGGMGRVWRAHDRKDDVWVALKFPDLRPDADRSFVLDLFRYEAAAYARLDHPNIVRVLDKGLDEPSPWYAMRWVQGESLADWLQRHLPPRGPGAGLPRNALRPLVDWVVDLAGAMAYAHICGVIHRDLKPDNLLLEHNPDDLEYAPDRRRVLRVVIIDFGLARLGHRPDLISSSHGAGTPRYAAPEVCAGENASPFADVYSLGAVLFDGAYGAPPPSPPTEADVEAERQRLGKSGEDVSARDAAEILFERTIAAALEEARTDRNLAAVIRRALAHNPARRYSMEALSADLRRYRDGLIPATRLQRSRRDGERDPAGRAEILASFCRRNLLNLALAASFLAAAAIGGANVWDWSQRQRRDAHNARAGAARTLVTEGRYPEALPYLDAALADGVQVDGDHAALERLRLRVLYGLNQRPRFDQELQRVLGTAAGGRDPDVQFIRGDFLLSDADHLSEGRSILREIAGRITSPADQHYVRGLLTSDLIQARSHWQDAVRTDYFHHLGRRALVMNLVICGEFDEARRQLDTARALFPWDLAWDLADSLTDLCQRDRPALERHTAALIARAEPQGLRDTAATYRAALRALDDALTGLDAFPPPDPAATDEKGPNWLVFLQQLGKLLQTAQTFDQLNRTQLAALGFRIATVTPVLETIPRIRRSLIDMVLGRYDLMATELEAALAGQPEAILAYLAASAHVMSGAIAQGRRNPEEASRQGRLARDLYLRAMNLPTLLPRADYRYMSRCCATMLEAAAIDEEHDADPVRRARLEGLIQSLIPEGQAFKAQRERLLPGVAQALEHLDRDSGRWLLQTWHRNEPGSAVALARLAQLELRAGHIEIAEAYADEVLALSPAGPGLQRLSELQRQMRSLRDDARQKTRDLPESIPAQADPAPP